MRLPRFLVDAFYLNDRQKARLVDYAQAVILYMCNTRDKSSRDYTRTALTILYKICGLSISAKQIRLCVERLRRGNRAEWARLLCNMHIADLHHPSRSLLAELKYWSPFRHKKIQYVECQLGYVGVYGEKPAHFNGSENSLVWPRRKKSPGLIERFCVLHPETGDGKPEVIPLEQDLDN